MEKESGSIDSSISRISCLCEVCDHQTRLKVKLQVSLVNQCCLFIMLFGLEFMLEFIHDLYMIYT